MSEENSNSFSENNESGNISKVEEEKENSKESKNFNSENEGVEKISIKKDNPNQNNNNENLINNKNNFQNIKIDSNGKSIFSQISENLYEKYLTTDTNKKLDIYEELTNNDFFLNSHNKF